MSCFTIAVCNPFLPSDLELHIFVCSFESTNESFVRTFYLLDGTTNNICAQMTDKCFPMTPTGLCTNLLLWLLLISGNHIVVSVLVSWLGTSK